jgi:hypothetical protein
MSPKPARDTSRGRASVAKAFMAMWWRGSGSGLQFSVFRGDAHRSDDRLCRGRRKTVNQTPRAYRSPLSGGWASSRSGRCSDARTSSQESVFTRPARYSAMRRSISFAHASDSSCAASVMAHILNGDGSENLPPKAAEDCRPALQGGYTARHPPREPAKRATETRSNLSPARAVYQITRSASCIWRGSPTPLCTVPSKLKMRLVTSGRRRFLLLKRLNTSSAGSMVMAP